MGGGALPPLTLCILSLPPAAGRGGCAPLAPLDFEWPLDLALPPMDPFDLLLEVGSMQDESELILEHVSMHL